MNGEEKLKQFRQEMVKRKYDAYIIPHGDKHDNEYIAEADERVKFISNFSGDNALGLVTKDVALMWTDGRFYIQIEKELYPGWCMKKMQHGEERLTEYLNKNIPKHSTIGIDFSLFSKEEFDSIQMSCPSFNFVDDKDNIIDKIWGKDKPSYKKDKLIILPAKYTGKTVLEKYEIIAEKVMMNLLKSGKISSFRLLLTKLDDIAWLLNLRGNDIPYNPVFFSYGLFYSNLKNKQAFHLYVDQDKTNTPELQEYFIQNKIIPHNYEEIYDELKNKKEGIITIVDSSSSNTRLFSLIDPEETNYFKIIDESIIEIEKSVKNEVEISGYKKANIRDCVALTKFLTWLEDELVTKKRTDLNEYEIGLASCNFRKQQELFMGESFAPICGAGPNSAIIHYEQSAEKHSDMSIDKMLLLDTGGQYMDGTTDITRTVHFGTPTAYQKEMYTRVLLGNLSLERINWKKGKKTFYELDRIPRYFLNVVQKDYLHGTSHGVGHFLNVHEGPHDHYLKEGNVMTNEPGYYEEDNFGIRIENSVLVVDKGNGFNGFENLTYLPYERNLFDMDLLSNDMVKYINNYHQKVWETISPYLKDDEKALDYLKRKTQPLTLK